MYFGNKLISYIGFKTNLCFFISYIIFMNEKLTKYTDNIPTKMLDFSVKFQQIISLMTATKIRFKLLEKIVAKVFKIDQKATSKSYLILLH